MARSSCQRFKWDARILPRLVLSWQQVFKVRILTITEAASFRKRAGIWGNLANAAMIVAASTVSRRSSNSRGTVNTTGNDYAEYIIKSHKFGIVAPGQNVASMLTTR